MNLVILGIGLVMLGKILIILIMPDTIRSHNINLGKKRHDLDNIMSDLTISDIF